MAESTALEFIQICGIISVLLAMSFARYSNPDTIWRVRVLALRRRHYGVAIAFDKFIGKLCHFSAAESNAD
jgi:hypothetical protein